MTHLLPVFYDDEPVSTKGTIWQNALRWVDYLSSAMSLIQEFQDIQEIHYTPESDQIWTYSEFGRLDTVPELEEEPWMYFV